MASDSVVTVPNLLSLARLVLSLVFFAAVERDWPAVAFWLFVIAASTDWIDGWYARRFDQVSRLGRIFDPLVDKVLVCGAYVLLAGRDSAIQPWMAVVVIVRELVVTAIRAEMERAGRDFSAALSGKLKMVLQCLTIGLVLAGHAWPELAPGGVGIDRLAGWVSWAAVIATIWSGFEYVLAARALVGR
ncbi:MAG: CDP-diacylglycerol--glycerol-3-phosphate 3-phosphatidyltransferase [Planctomycetes bacterium]|nr:CDP-diacylglycerol--glycerol-3-phosphate 3-phosphatidyltransferase [Planctomycetota bacterium]